MRRKWKEESEAPSFVDLYGANLSPLLYFATRFNLHQIDQFPLSKKHHLPTFSDLSGEEGSSPVSMGWSQDGLYIGIKLSKTIFEVDPIKYQNGDAIELFFDTRDQKKGTHMTPFCHHFLFYPERIAGIYGKEITTFRGDEKHDLANPFDLKLEQVGKLLQIYIPSHALHGFDPSLFNRLGFNYIIHQKGEEPTQLTAKAPSCWASATFAP